MAEGVEIGNIEIPLIKGDTGAKGDAGKITSLAVTMLPSTATPTVTNNGSVYDAKYVLGIPKGTGVSTASINEDNELVIELTDGTEVNVGNVVGVSVSTVYIDAEYNLIMVLSDDNEINVGNLEIELTSIINDFLADYYDKDAVDDLLDGVGNKLDLSINSSTYVMTISLLDANDNALSTKTVDLPLESVVVSGSYDSVNKKIVLTLQSGSTVEFSVADLVAGLQSEITNANKLSADLVDDTSTTNKFVTSTEKAKIANAITATDYATDSTGGTIKLGHAAFLDSNKKITATQYSGAQIWDGTAGVNDFASIGSVKQAITAKIASSVTSSSTNTESVGAKLFYDTIGNLETILETLDIGGGVE